MDCVDARLDQPKQRSRVRHISSTCIDAILCFSKVPVLCEGLFRELSSGMLVVGSVRRLVTMLVFETKPVPPIMGL